MDVIFIAVIGRADRDDGFQLRWPACGHLQCIETAPRNAEHAELSRAPFLRGDPANHFNGVVLLLLCIFIQHHAFAVTASAHIHANGGIAVARKIRVGKCIAHNGAIALAIGQIFQHGGNGMPIRIHGQPHARCQLHAIGHGNPEIIDFLYLARKGLDGCWGHGWAQTCFSQNLLHASPTFVNKITDRSEARVRID